MQGKMIYFNNNIYVTVNVLIAVINNNINNIATNYNVSMIFYLKALRQFLFFLKYLH